MNRFNDGSDVTVLKNKASRFLPKADDDIHHGPGQVVGPNDLIGEQHPKSRVDRAQQAIAQKSHTVVQGFGPLGIRAG